ncbi:Rpn family recombination-promoting nuclease/putative transposase [Paracandidimonas soli]|uniref:Putative transposase/invertase (TIGR01784 family) n=1 Tax=Paracandidimonas soli TaxID=1917182 RepID=A0A4R3VJF3_9BURK|nr:Rpn family recombination-promoting nuclease/putative transposase [Paracandidimonas soli]TCV03135.1 putative transposase/invertase (TIGR01784 family) [Paracandidimonas soli]
MTGNTSSSKPPKPPSLANDLIFKALFCRQRHLLADLINAVRQSMPPVSIVDILNPSILPEDISGKNIVLDILARDPDGTLFLIEMQLRHYLHWAERNTYYLARGLANQLQAGQDYRHLKPAVGISLLANDLFPDERDKACWHFSLRDSERPRIQLGQALQVHIIELSKAESLHGLPQELFAWIACLQHATDDTAMSQISHPPVKEALQHLETLISDRELRMLAERREQAIIDDIDALDYARTEGMRQGLEQGLEQGKAALLTQQLTRKFGPLPVEIQQRLRTALVSELDAWALNLLDATTLNDVFHTEP